MNLWTKALISGIAVESFCFYLMYWAGGPMTPLGAVFTVCHFPALILVMPFAFLELPKWVELSLIFMAASLCWTLISCAVLNACRRQ